MPPEGAGRGTRRGHAGAGNLETLVWLADALAFAFERDRPGLRPYLSAVADEVLFEADLDPRARPGYPRLIHE